MVIIKPVHFPSVSGIEREKIVREFLPFDLGKCIQLRLELGPLPGSDVKGVVKSLRAEDDSLEGTLFHLADVLPDKIGVRDVPAILDNFLLWTLPGNNTHRGKQSKNKQ
ncbi:hypothetical protein ES703_119150 [subsurface metagenome]